MSKTYISTQLRRLIVERSQGCCAYCLQPELFSFCAHEVDHVIAEKHGGKTVVENLTLACKLCNTLKGSDIASIDPESGKIVRLYQLWIQAGEGGGHWQWGSKGDSFIIKVEPKGGNQWDCGNAWVVWCGHR